MKISGMTVLLLVLNLSNSKFIARTVMSDIEKELMEISFDSDELIFAQVVSKHVIHFDWPKILKNTQTIPFTI